MPAPTTNAANPAAVDAKKLTFLEVGLLCFPMN
jgi:hypothetical protein